MNPSRQSFSILRRWRTAIRDDSGVSAILIAILVVMVALPISAVAVDLSNGYANRRQMQNAADAASMAAADAFISWKAGGANTLDATAARVAASNGGANVSSCELVRVTYTSGSPAVDPVGACSGGTWGTANGVRVTTDRDVSTFFAPALPGGGPDSTSAGAVATASLQKVVAGWAPFALCSYWDPAVPTDKHAEWPDKDDSLTLLNPAPDDSINQAAIGKLFPVWGVGNSTSHCGLEAASWKGVVQCEGNKFGDPCPITLPTVPYGTGAKTGPVLTTVAGTIGCTPSTIPDSSGDSPCSVALPVCRSGDKMAKTLNCPTWGAFMLSYVNKGGGVIMGELLGAATLTGGVGGADDPGQNDAVVIGLVG